MGIGSPFFHDGSTSGTTDRECFTLKLDFAPLVVHTSRVKYSGNTLPETSTCVASDAGPSLGEASL